LFHCIHPPHTMAFHNAVILCPHWTIPVNNLHCSATLSPMMQYQHDACPSSRPFFLVGCALGRRSHSGYWSYRNFERGKFCTQWELFVKLLQESSYSCIILSIYSVERLHFTPAHITPPASKATMEVSTFTTKLPISKPPSGLTRTLGFHLEAFLPSSSRWNNNKVLIVTFYNN
jgi:hypothetical protein